MRPSAVIGRDGNTTRANQEALAPVSSAAPPVGRTAHQPGKATPGRKPKTATAISASPTTEARFATAATRAGVDRPAIQANGAPSGVENPRR
jgi:hypothetical protein